jgi:uncharacterized damage-inducible protein DinB/uncharacterized protein YciI
MKRTVLFMLTALAAQAASANFFLVYELAPGVDFTHLTPQQMGILQQHGANLVKLREAGTLLTGGRIMYDPQHARGIAILVAESEAAAKEIAAADPAVRAGIMLPKVEPVDLVFPPPSAAPVVPDSRASYELITGFILAAAKKMPEAQYGFRPTPEVRTFAQLLGHIADTQYLGCSAAAGEEYKPRNIEKTVTAKAEMIAALEGAVAYCEATWAKTTAQSAAAPVTFLGKPHTRLGLLDLGTAHAFEHYGNMVTYLRMQHVVPPSSESAN